ILVKSVFAVPKEVRDVEATAKALSTLTGQSVSDIRNKFSTAKGKQFVWIDRKVSNAESTAIARAKLPGIHFQDESRRFYPNGELAAHVLGYVGVDEQGLGGLEGRYNDNVRGEPGQVIYISDGRRKNYNQTEQPAQPGANLVTTIDKN